MPRRAFSFNKSIKLYLYAAVRDEMNFYSHFPSDTTHTIPVTSLIMPSHEGLHSCIFRKPEACI